MAYTIPRESIPRPRVEIARELQEGTAESAFAAAVERYTKIHGCPPVSADGRCEVLDLLRTAELMTIRKLLGLLIPGGDEEYWKVVSEFLPHVDPIPDA